MFREPQLARPIWIPVQGQERLQNHLEPRIIARPKKKTKNLPNHQFLQCRLWFEPTEQGARVWFGGRSSVFSIRTLHLKKTRILTRPRIF